MPKINEEQNKLDEDVKNTSDKVDELLNQIKEQNNLSDDELKTVKAMIEMAIKKGKKTKKQKILNIVKKFFFKAFILYIVSLIVFGFLFSFLALNNNLEIFVIALIVGFILSLYELLPSLVKNSNPKLYIVLLVLIIFNFCLLNNLYTVFNGWYIWIMFFIAVELIYGLIAYYIVNRRISL